MSKINTNGMTYCIMQSGYTGRLIDMIGFNNAQLIKKDKTKKEDCNNMYKMNHSKYTDEYKDFINNCCDQLYCSLNDSFLDSFFENLVFISDTNYGDGTYYVKSDSVEKIQSILKKERIDFFGTICFRCNNVYECMQYVKMLRTANYCAMLDFDTMLDITIIQNEDEKILMIVFDSESG